MAGNGFLKFGAKQNNLLVNLPLTPAAGLVGKVTGGVTFTRASDQWYQDGNGVWQKATPGNPAIGPNGILLEPASTNKCTCYGAIPADTLGAELLTTAADRDFSSDTGFWTKEAGWAISGGAANATAITGTNALYKTIGSFGRVYTLTFTVTGYVSGSLRASIGALGTTFLDVSANGTYTVTGVMNGVGSQIRFTRAAADFTGAIDNISVKEVQFAAGTKTYYTGGSWVYNHTNITLSGDTAAVLTTVDETAALAAAGLQGICASGKVYKIDNSAGVGGVFVGITGQTGNVNPHSLVIFCKTVGTPQATTYLRLAGNATGNLRIPTCPTYALVKNENVTPDSSVKTLELRVNQGDVLYFALPQLEEITFSTSPIPTAGAIATRAALNFTFPVAENTKSNDFTVCGVVEFAAVAPNAYPQVFVANNAGSTASIAVQLNVAAMSFYAQKMLPGPVYKATGTSNVALAQQVRFAAVFSSTGIRFFVNGVQNAANADGTGVDLSGALSLPAFNSVKRVKSFRIYRRALSDAQCIALTT